MEGKQVDEAVLSLFHTLLFHRSTGKFHYKNDNTYAVGTIGFQDVDCDFIDFTYVSYRQKILSTSHVAYMWIEDNNMNVMKRVQMVADKNN